MRRFYVLYQDLRFIVLIISDEEYAVLPRPCVVILRISIRSQVSVKDVYIDLRVQFLQFQSVSKSFSATYPTAVRTFLASASHTLDHNHGF